MNKLIIFSLVFALFTACKKDDTTVETDTDKDLRVAEDNTLAENASDDISTMSDEAYNTGSLQTRSGQSATAILRTDSVVITKADSVITIDFGAAGTVCRDGKLRKGKITITFTGGYRKAGGTVTQTFNNYSVNGNQFSNTSTRSITYNGLNSAGNPNWSITANITITKSGGIVVAWTSNRVRTMIAGYDTKLNWLDDEYQITGTASGSRTNGSEVISFSLTIGTPLYIKTQCSHIQGGTLNMTRGQRSISINYGYGTGTPCDGQAEITLPDGSKRVVNL